MKHWFWLTLIILTGLWYIFVTLIVAIRGARNIRDMLSNMKNKDE